MNTFNIAGRLTKDFEARIGKGDDSKPYGFFTLAINNGKDNTDFLDVTVFGKLAEVLAQYGKKGMSLAVNGTIKKGGKDQDYKMSLVADKLTFLSNKEK